VPIPLAGLADIGQFRHVNLGPDDLLLLRHDVASSARPDRTVLGGMPESAHPYRAPAAGYARTRRSACCLTCPLGRPRARRAARHRGFPTRRPSGHNVDKADEVDAMVVEAIPARALGAFAVALQIGLTVLFVDDIVLARHIIAAWRG
jgi:hypothetical protein